MARGGLFGLALILTAAQPPVVAPKPHPTAKMPGCDACRLLAIPRSTGRIIPVQDGPSFETAARSPAPLLLPQDATPLPVEEPSAVLNDLLDRFLPNAKPEERSAWADELRHLPPELARDILAARSKSNEPQVLPELPSVLAEPMLPPRDEPEVAPSPLRSARRSDSLAPDATVAALRQAEAILLHNIANADTVAFKRSCCIFTEAPGSGGLSGVTAQLVVTQGESEQTGRPFDLTIGGTGFFQLRRGETVALTRRGTFALNAAGELVSEIAGEEWSLHPPVHIPAEAAETVIDEAGTVACRLAGDDALTQVGQIELARVLDPSRLEPAGGGLLAVPKAAGAVVVGLPVSTDFGIVRQGSLEQSNVDLAAELKTLKRLRTQITALQSLAPPSLASPAEPGAVRAAETPTSPTF